MGTFKDLYDIIKDLLKVAKDAGNQILVDKAMDIQAKLFELKEENENLKDEIKKLQEKILDYDKTADIETQLIQHKKPYYTLKGDVLNIKYCAHCWQTDKKLIQLDKRNGFYPSCPQCKEHFGISEEEYNG